MYSNRHRTILAAMYAIEMHEVIHDKCPTNYDIARYLNMTPNGIRKALMVAKTLGYVGAIRLRTANNGGDVLGWYVMPKRFEMLRHVCKMAYRSKTKSLVDWSNGND